MFWKVLFGITKVSINLSRSATALGAAVVITVGVYDYLKSRNNTEQARRLR